MGRDAKGTVQRKGLRGPPPVRWLSHRARRRLEGHTDKRGTSALTLLRERYAPGDIGRDEFHRMRQDLS